MNFKTALKEERTVSNNQAICELQQKYEGLAWMNQDTARKLKLAVKWLRDNPDKTANEAIEKFMN